MFAESDGIGTTKSIVSALGLFLSLLFLQANVRTVKMDGNFDVAHDFELQSVLI